jgi:hypothetical protein
MGFSVIAVARKNREIEIIDSGLSERDAQGMKALCIVRRGTDAEFYRVVTDEEAAASVAEAKTPYQQGIQAAQAGADQRDNPHRRGTDAHMDWEQGRQDAAMPEADRIGPVDHAARRELEEEMRLINYHRAEIEAKYKRIIGQLPPQPLRLGREPPRDADWRYETACNEFFRTKTLADAMEMVDEDWARASAAYALMERGLVLAGKRALDKIMSDAADLFAQEAESQYRRSAEEMAADDAAGQFMPIAA